MAFFLKIFAFLCALSLLVLFRTGTTALLSDSGEEGGEGDGAGDQAGEEVVCEGLSTEALLDVTARKGSAVYPFRKDVQEALKSEISRVSETLRSLLADETADSGSAGRKAVVIEAVPETHVQKILVAWRLAKKQTEKLDLVVLKEEAGETVTSEFFRQGCVDKVGDGRGEGSCFVVEAGEVPWSIYEGVVLGASTEPLPKEFPEKFPKAMRSMKSMSVSAKNHLKWLARKLRLMNEAVEMVEIGNLFVDRKLSKTVFELRRLLRRWLEDYEFTKYEKTSENGDDYWPWTRRVQLANSLVGNFIRAEFVESLWVQL